MSKEKESKRVYVYMDEQQHVKLKIRLNYLGISMSEFVRTCADGLLNQHPIMEQYMDHYRETSEKIFLTSLKRITQKFEFERSFSAL